MESLADHILAVVASLMRFGSNNTIPGAFVALCIAVAFTLARVRRSRSVPFKVLRRAILPKRVFRSHSGRTDIAFTVFGLFASAAALGWAVLSQTTIRSLTEASLLAVSSAPDLVLPSWAITSLTTVAFYLAYEFGYWLYHYLSHRYEWLWRFHAVHHSAESLSPLTNFRVHPVDTMLFGNALAIINGIVAGVLHFLFGSQVQAFTIDGANILVLVSLTLLGTLQHTHFWISFRGPWGKLFLSPAHHQIHHSTDPRHYNTNLGSTLAIFDRLFGTLHVPAERRERLTFGVIGIENPHALSSTVFRPFAEALQVMAGSLRRALLRGGRPAGPAPQT